MNLREIDPPSSGFIMSATNDDMIVGCICKQDAEEYLLADQRNNALLGMAYKDTKTGIAMNRFVYCEEYYIDGELANKDSLFTVAMVGAWHAASPFMAKEYVYSILLSAPEITPGIERCVWDVQAVVGWEFHEDEWRWPFLFGGWLPCIKDGLDHSIEWYDGDLRAIAGYWATRVRLRPKGTLGDQPKLAIGRKIGLRLVAEPDDLPDWVDLVPLLGTKRTLARHYRRAQTDPKRIAREYDLLATLRDKKFKNIMSAVEEAPSPMIDWLDRHPNSVWLHAGQGLQLADPVGRVPYPALGFKDNSFVMRMLMMKKKGWVDVDFHGITSSSQIYLAERGVLSPLKYKYLPVSDSGISIRLLQDYYPGFIPWYEKYGMVPTAICSSDYPLDCTKLWPYCYTSTLLTLVRCWKYIIPKIDQEVTPSVCIWIAQLLHKIGMAESEGTWDHPDEDIDPGSENALVLESHLREVIRDWIPDPDAYIEQMRDRIIPLRSEERPPEYSDLLSTQVTMDPYTLLGSRQEDSGMADGPEGEPPDDLFDPWGELGV
jgi:hypothetical protein